MKQISMKLICSIMLLTVFVLPLFAGETTETPELVVKCKSETLPLVSYKQYKEKVKLTIGETVIQAKRTPDKRKYKLGDKVYKAKHKENKIKVYDVSGKLLWKVKVKDDKIKVMQTEDGEPVYVVKIKTDKYKIMRGETLMASVKKSSDKSGVKVVNAVDQRLYKIAESRFSLAFSVLAMEEIPEEHRAILFSELYLAGY